MDNIDENIENIKALFYELENSPIWKETIQMNYKLSDPQFKYALSEFKKMCMTEAAEHSSQTLRRKFSYWLPMNMDKILKIVIPNKI